MLLRKILRAHRFQRAGFLQRSVNEEPDRSITLHAGSGALPAALYHSRRTVTVNEVESSGTVILNFILHNLLICGLSN